MCVQLWQTFEINRNNAAQCRPTGHETMRKMKCANTLGSFELVVEYVSACTTDLQIGHSKIRRDRQSLMKIEHETYVIIVEVRESEPSRNF